MKQHRIFPTYWHYATCTADKSLCFLVHHVVYHVAFHNCVFMTVVEGSKTVHN